MNEIAQLIPVVLVSVIVVFALLKKVRVFQVFTVGAKKGMMTAVSILPTLIGIITAITMLSKSGLLEEITNLAKPICSLIGLPKELLPLAILRPISGSGSTGAVIEIFENKGPDSLVGVMASVLSASTETSFYAVSVYFAKYKSTKYTLPVALLGDFIAVVGTVLVVNMII